MWGVLLTAAGLFAVTNIDGFVVLTVLFWASAGGIVRPWQIVAGQFLGFTAIVAVSWLVAAGLVRLPGRWAGLVGLLPLALGVWGLIKARRSRDETAVLAGNGLWPVVAVVLANGVDNISVYAPLFAASNVTQIMASIAVFYTMLTVWCALAWSVGRNKKAVSALVGVGKWVAPAVFLLIGLAILIKSGVLSGG